MVLLSAPPVQAADADCLTCHQEKSTGVSIHSAIDMGCAVCHIGVDASKVPHRFSGASKGLPSEGAELCFSCHDKREFESAREVHQPVSSGMCNICHDSHASSFSGLLTSANVCLGCHEEEGIGNKPVVHQPVSTGICTICHTPHKSETDHLLKSSVPGLCFNCHEKKTIIGPDVHLPVGLGMCMSCHDPHQSDAKGLSKSGQPELCFSCHEKEDVLKKDIHQRERMGLCMECHRPHAGKNTSLPD